MSARATEQRPSLKPNTEDSLLFLDKCVLYTNSGACPRFKSNYTDDRSPHWRLNLSLRCLLPSLKENRILQPRIWNITTSRRRTAEPPGLDSLIHALWRRFLRPSYQWTWFLGRGCLDSLSLSFLNRRDITLLLTGTLSQHLLENVHCSVFGTTEPALIKHKEPTAPLRMTFADTLLLSSDSSFSQTGWLLSPFSFVVVVLQSWTITALIEMRHLS